MSRWACSVVAGGALVLAVVSPVAAGERWPSWPTEIDRVAAPLRSTDERIAGERERAAALSRLEEFATEVIEDEVIAALEDAASQVRREALRLCYVRRMTRCIGEASAVWGKGIDPTLRIAALRVMALDLDMSRLAIVLQALRDPSEEMREQAAQVLGWATPPDSSRDEVRSALLAKLSDSAALVRRRAVESLGLLGPGPGTLAMSRLLDDPEPTVRSAAALALARARDGRAAPALIRAADGQNEAIVAQAILGALAQLPSIEVGRALLRKLDDPPAGLSALQVADALGGRPDPETEVIEGLIERLREPELRPAALRALLLLGEPTKPHLKVALARGLDPSTQLELERLLAALQPGEPPTLTSVPTMPAPEDRNAWALRLSVGSPQERLDAAARLGEVAPRWLDAAVTRRLERGGVLTTAAPWLLALATASRSLEVGDDRWLPWARVTGWARDGALAASDRCLAVVALSRGPRRHRRRIERTLTELVSEADPRVRGCVAVAASRRDPAIAELLLVDRDPGVRAAAALAVRASPDATISGRTRVEAMARIDPSGPVRRAAGAPVTRTDEAPALAWFSAAAPSVPWSVPARWLELELGTTRVTAPAVGRSGVRFALVPALPGATVVPPADPRR
jgi:HEAT repeat protein